MMNSEEKVAILTGLQSAKSLVRRPFRDISRDCGKTGDLVAVVVPGAYFEAHANDRDEIWLYRDGVLRHEDKDAEAARWIRDAAGHPAP